jgi:uncharacterized membrane protein YphA (DoxX/SURF4 family)/thiol-disulfide isomerase/thioredoxin
MRNMDESTSDPAERAARAGWGISTWKTTLSAAAAFLLALLFVVAGVWKITDPFAAAQRMAQAQVPAQLSLFAACMFGIAETFAAALLVVPRFRRWGAWAAGLLLVAFLVYIGYYYNVLRGEECNCFPWLRRAVGPAFFIGDALMLALAVIAGWWARPSQGVRAALLVLMAVAVFAVVSLGVSARLQQGAKAPASITVDGKPVALGQGRFLIFFFDPECTHCNDAAREMAKLSWRNVRIIGVATEQPQFSAYFMNFTGLHASVSNDVALLKKVFPFTSAPYAVAIENGREKEAFSDFDPQRMRERLRRLGFIN